MSGEDIFSRARKLYPNQGMHRNAEFIASLHPRAIDYLEQAPVLAAAFGVKKNTRADRLWLAMRIGGPIERGERLRTVMASAGIHAPLRKLSGYAVQPFMSAFVRDLNDLDPSTLSQSIPEKASAQRKWLSAMRAWRLRMEMNGRPLKLGFSWIARNAKHCVDGQAGDFADFLSRNPDAPIDRWTYDRMQYEVELWHDRLAAETSVSQIGFGLTLSTVIDLSDWPDHAEDCGFEFFKLTTPGMLMEEGRRMRHCVSTYIPRVMNGSCHIYSVRAGMRRMATAEIVGNRVVQLKAFANRPPLAAVARSADHFVRDHAPTPNPQRAKDAGGQG